ncbi:hypothetical protein SAMN05216573_1135 [Bradyrhizobium sp. Rc3b]|nr:hypothetical protein SAMN05216573_1135 [Bradyrhizobium sp. Rc3b]
MCAVALSHLSTWLTVIARNCCCANYWMESSGTSHDERVFVKLVVVVKFGACVTGCISGVMARDMDFEVNGAVEVTIACTSSL